MTLCTRSQQIEITWQEDPELRESARARGPQQYSLHRSELQM